MSQKYIAAVWEMSGHRKNELLLLLALAHEADENGLCYASMQHLVHKTRLLPSKIRSCTDALEQSGELDMQYNKRGSAYTLRYPGLR